MAAIEQQIHAVADEQRGPAQHLHAPGSTGDTSHQPTASISTPKKRFGIHPHAGFRQQRAGRHADQDQRHAHAHGHGKQRAAADHDIARLADVDQRAASGAATHGPTIRAEIAPITNTPASLPEAWRFETC
jgi:hypothetical protein